MRNHPEPCGTPRCEEVLMKITMQFDAYELVSALAPLRHMIDQVEEAVEAARLAAQKTDHPDILHPHLPSWADEGATIEYDDGYVTIRVAVTSVTVCDTTWHERSRRYADGLHDGMQPTSYS